MGTLRFLLALCVVVTHGPDSKLFGHALMSGITAVQGFYIVSGFLITLVLNTRAEYRDVRSFYVSRYLRLWPAYAVVAALSFSVFKREFLVNTILQLDWLGASFVVISNVILFFQDLYLFLSIAPNGALYLTTHFQTEPGLQLNALMLVPQAWSLGIELAFYAIAPLFCRSPWRLLGLLSIGLLVRLALGYWSPAIDPWTYRFEPAEMTFFAIGGLGYFASCWLDRVVPARSLRVAGNLCLLALVAIIVAPPVGLQGFAHRTFLLNQTILVLIAASCPLLLIVSRGRKWDSLIGELSYPIYLSHIMVYTALATYAPASMTQGGLIYVGATMIFSAALYWLVVRPVDRYRRRFGARVPSDFLPTIAIPEGAAAWSNRSGQ
jgi:peptidoglycan/LPS O-acetylase OafA/YrhL